MPLCFGNLTVGVYGKLDELHIKIVDNGKRITGILGEYIHQYLTHGNRNNCNYKLIKFVIKQHCEKENEKNLTALKMFERNELDVHSDPTNIIDIKDYSENDEIEFMDKFVSETKIVHKDSFIVSQILNKPTEYKTDASSFLIQNPELLIIILIGYILLIAINYLFLKLFKHKFTDWRTIKFNCIKLLFLDFEQIRFLSSKFAFIFLFFNLFIFILINFICSNVRTEAVILKTDDFIDSAEKLSTTSKIFTFLFFDSHLFNKSRPDSFLYKIYYRKVIKEKRFYILNEFKQSENNNIHEFNPYFFFMRRISLSVIFAIFNPLLNPLNQFIFLKPANYFEMLYSFLMRNTLDKERRMKIISRVDQSFENGFYSNYYEKCYNRIMAMVNPEIKVFSYLEEYLNEYSSASDLELDNFENTFKIFFTICFIILFLFILNWIFKLFTKLLRIER